MCSVRHHPGGQVMRAKYIVTVLLMLVGLLSGAAKCEDRAPSGSAGNTARATAVQPTDPEHGKGAAKRYTVTFTAEWNATTSKCVVVGYAASTRNFKEQVCGSGTHVTKSFSIDQVRVGEWVGIRINPVIAGEATLATGTIRQKPPTRFLCSATNTDKGGHGEVACAKPVVAT